MVKRVGNLYEQVCSTENLLLALKNSKRGKSHLEQVCEVYEDPG